MAEVRGRRARSVSRRSRCPSTKVVANGKSGSQWRRSGVEGRGRCPGEVGVEPKSVSRRRRCRGEVGVRAKSVYRRRRRAGEVGGKGKPVSGGTTGQGDRGHARKTYTRGSL